MSFTEIPGPALARAICMAGSKQQDSRKLKSLSWPAKSSLQISKRFSQREKSSHREIRSRNSQLGAAKTDDTRERSALNSTCLRLGHKSLVLCGNHPMCVARMGCYPRAHERDTFSQP